MTTLTWHIERAKESLEDWYSRADDYLVLAAKCRRHWMYSTEKECKRWSLKCRTLGIVFHDRYKLVLEEQ